MTDIRTLIAEVQAEDRRTAQEIHEVEQLLLGLVVKFDNAATKKWGPRFATRDREWTPDLGEDDE